MSAETQASEVQVIAQVESIRVVIDYLGKANIILNIDPSDIDADPQTLMLHHLLMMQLPLYDFSFSLH